MNTVAIRKTETRAKPDIHQPLSNEVQCMFWVSERGDIHDSAGPVEKMFGYSPKELSGLPVSRLLPDLDRYQLVIEGKINSILHHRCHCQIPFRALRKNGEEKKCLMHLNLLSNPSGHRLTLTLTFHDQVN
jgi:PAS domain S-box-containing protein